MSGMTTDDKLVYMANQIARNFEAMGYDRAARATEDHMISFWDPRMKSRIVALADADPSALTDAARAAVAALRAGVVPPPQTAATDFAGGSDAG